MLFFLSGVATFNSHNNLLSNVYLTHVTYKVNEKSLSHIIQGGFRRFSMHTILHILVVFNSNFVDDP